MNSIGLSRGRISLTEWLVILAAVIGFAFDSYELLMLPLIAGPAIAEILQMPPNNPQVTLWVGRMLWMTALCGGIFGLGGGWLIDRFGRKTVFAGSVMLYSLSPFAAALSTTLPWFLFFRCATFVGVCVEFIAAVTWLAELFPEPRRKEIVLGWTQAFASVGGLLVTAANSLTLKYAAALPGLPVPEPFNAHASWRYTLLTGFLPAAPILLLLPFVPESIAWTERRRLGTLLRPSLRELFSRPWRKVTLVTAALSACAYAAAFGALQLTPTRIAPGLATVAEPRNALLPLQTEARTLNQQFNATQPAFNQATKVAPHLFALAGERIKTRRAMTEAKKSWDATDKPEIKAAFATELAGLTNQMAQWNSDLDTVSASAPDAKSLVLDREKLLAQIAANRAKQDVPDQQIKAVGNKAQFFQETGGLAGRLALAALLLLALRRRALLRLFQIPGVVIFPLTYLYLFRHQPEFFAWGVAAAGFLTIGQFSYFGEYLPKAFPLHLRGVGGAFATNVGGRMFGTSAAFLTTNLIAPSLPGNTYEQVALASALVGTAVFAIGLGLSFALPEPATAVPASQ